MNRSKNRFPDETLSFATSAGIESASRQGLPSTTSRLSTGVTGFDEILDGGLVAHRAYLLRGGPGSGKTTLGMHFLAAGVERGETCLFITMGEPEAEIRQNAQAFTSILDKMHFLDLSPSASFFTEMQSYDIFSPAEVEREPITQRIMSSVEELRPQRVFLDAMTQFRFLNPDDFQFRKQVLSFLRFLVEQGATVLFTSEGSVSSPDDDLQFMSDGVIHLHFSPESRAISVSKFRGSDFQAGSHVMRLTDTGMRVFPRLLPQMHTQSFVQEKISSGVPEIDELLHGGIERGTISMITGPTGVGKTTLGLQFMKEAAGRGERSVVYTFEEIKETLLNRCEAVNIPVRTMQERGILSVIQVEPLRFTPDEFARVVRQEVEQQGSRIVMIDSISGYSLSLKGHDLVEHLHALCKYLQNMGIAVLLINEVTSVAGEFKVTEFGLSYLADNIIFLRYLELKGEMRRAIGVLKKRLSNFERTIREIEISRYGIKVGKPLTDIQGILTGDLRFMGQSDRES
ncbi:ATPase domain-containing protein [Dictyobacter aurantiacus]|uniref:non-specific serine/threonine protein kinase n=1 Tax=Dictyobacter aurantiacus TaxID=1936993 RepID=A0A401ZCQ4_9CHLR|nr:ATPase domain-containing protein [Dictyobacter aurantiacus]GCE04635.1 serine/threonine protein kinase [Dictyobacter aurantiacus]